jgi:hypothetical protein
MNYQTALKYMEKGGKIKRKSWLKNDYLYLKDGLLYCDGDFPYLSIPSVLKTKNRLFNGEWIGI